MPPFVTARLLSLLCRRAVGAVVVVVLLALGGGYAWYRWLEASAAALSQQEELLQRAMDQDTPLGYRQVVQSSQGLLRRGKANDFIRQMATYAATILAIEHQDSDMLPLARKLLSQQQQDAAHDLEGQQGYLSAARILMAYGDGDLTEGLALAESMHSVAAGFVMAKLEGLRLMVAAHLDPSKITAVAQALADDVGHEVRALHYLGTWQLFLGNTAQAEQYLRRALAGSPNHPQALLGLQWVHLCALHPTAENVWRAHKQVGEILRLPPLALTPPIRATALLVRALALELEGEAPQAERDRAEALQLDPGNLLHEGRRDGAERFERRLDAQPL